MTTHQEPAQRSASSRATANGTPASPRTASRRERPPRLPRRYGQWASALVFISVTVLTAGWLWQSKSDRVEVLAVREAVPVGTVIDRGDLETLQVAGLGEAIRVSDLDTVVGTTAAVGLVAGQVLSPDMLTTKPVPGPGQRVLGVEVGATRAPGGLLPGDIVSVVAVPPSGDVGKASELESPRTLASQAKVKSVRVVEGSGTRLTLVVPKALAGRVAAFGAAGRVAVIQAPLGGDR